MEETISLQELFGPLKKRFVLVILIAAILTIASGFISYLMLTPIYRAKTQILVQSESNQRQFDYNQLQANLKLVNTYSVIIKSPRILDKVVNQLNLNQSAEQLRNQLTVNSEKDSQVVNIAVEDPSPKKAVKVANTIADVFQEQISKIMNVNNVSILSKADLGPNAEPVSPNPEKNMAIAFVIGVIIGVAITYILEYMDNTIKDEKDIDLLLGLPTLGAVPEIEADEKGVLSHSAKRRRESETFGA